MWQLGWRGGAATLRRVRWARLEVDSRSHCDQTRPILRSCCSSEVWIPNGSIDTEVRPVECVECVCPDLQTKAVPSGLWPQDELLDNGDVIDEHRRLPDLAVVLRGCPESKIRWNRKRGCIEI